MVRFIGFDVHMESTTFGVVGQSGRRLKSGVIQTTGYELIETVKALRRPRHVCLEEGTHSQWIYDLLVRHADSIKVVVPAKQRGNKNDKKDAFALANLIRTGQEATVVFKDLRGMAELKEAARGYAMIRGDLVRCKNRIKAAYRAYGIACGGDAVFSERSRDDYLAQTNRQTRLLLAPLYCELEFLTKLKTSAQQLMLDEARKHRIFSVLRTVPGLGPIRVAQMMPIIVTPHRFRTKRQLWSYAGLGVVTHASAEWARVHGRWERQNTRVARGLNRNHNRTLKEIFKSAALTATSAQQTGQFREQYLRLIDAQTKPNLAQLTVARSIAAVTLAIWKTGKEYDPKRSTNSR